MAGVVRLWNDWEVQILVLVSFMLQVFLLMFARMRRRNISIVPRTLLWLAYLLADSIAIYILGHMSFYGKSHGHQQLMAFWAPFLLVHLGGQDNITAYSIEDSQLWPRHLLSFIVQTVGVAYVLYKYVAGSWTLVTGAALIFVSGVLKYGERVWALKSSSLDNMRKFLDSRKLSEAKQGQRPRWGHGDNFDIERVLQGAHDLLPICMAQFVDYKFWPSAFESEAIEVFYKKGEMFELVEMQLSLMYDFLYTKAVVVFTWYGCFIRAVSSVASITTFFLFQSSIGKNDFNRVDAIVTYILIAGAILLEMTAVWKAMGSTWACALLHARRWHRLHRIVVSVRRRFKTAERNRRWSGSIGHLELHYSSLGGGGCVKSLRRKDLWKVYHSLPIISNGTKKLVLEVVERMVEKCEGKEDIMRSYNGQCTLNAWSGFFKDPTSHAGIDFDEKIISWYFATEIFFSWSSREEEHGYVVEAIKELSNYMTFLLVERPYMLPSPVRHGLYANTEAAYVGLDFSDRERISRKWGLDRTKKMMDLDKRTDMGELLKAKWKLVIISEDLDITREDLDGRRKELDRTRPALQREAELNGTREELDRSWEELDRRREELDNIRFEVGILEVGTTREKLEVLDRRREELDRRREGLDRTMVGLYRMVKAYGRERELEKPNITMEKLEELDKKSEDLERIGLDLLYEAELHGTKERLERSWEELNIRRGELDIRREELNRRREELFNSRFEVARTREKMEVLNRRREELDRTRKGLERMVWDYRGGRERGELNRTMEKLEELDRRMEELDRRRPTLQREAELKGIKQLDISWEELDIDWEELNRSEELDDLRFEVGTTREKLEVLDRRREELDNRREVLDRRREGLDRIVRAYRGGWDLDMTMKNLEELDKRREELDRRIEDLDIRREGLSRIDRAYDEGRVLEELKKMMKKLEELDRRREELDRRRDELDKRRFRIDNKGEENLDLARIIKKLDRRIEELRFGPPPSLVRGAGLVVRLLEAEAQCEVEAEARNEAGVEAWGKAEVRRVLLGVWVEMLCYAAHHCSRDSHARQLNSGGEFITIVWLLSTAMFNRRYSEEHWFKKGVRKFFRPPFRLEQYEDEGCMLPLCCGIYIV
ncbi:hypothetical protein CFC21_026922 [Triticum aestivum]|uniref:DUF4220 domain-containing protein n=2 Tax=Triticum aestivum TaxID=4565 RepID=A0A3B6CJR8_WHEAT|nr:uncharacterized protein LOC123047570 [Triticum aestivum]KAF7012763.1 hypothetical protein CFC21_026922 [Triticum aestivum]